MKKLRLLICTMLICMCSVLPMQASEAPVEMTQVVFKIPMTQQGDIMPIFDNFMEISFNYGFDDSNMLYYDMTLTPYHNTSYFSGMLRLYDGDGNVLALHTARDTDIPYVTDEYSYQADWGDTFQIGFSGHVYRIPGGHGERVDLRSSIFKCER